MRYSKSCRWKGSKRSVRAGLEGHLLRAGEGPHAPLPARSERGRGSGCSTRVLEAAVRCRRTGLRPGGRSGRRARRGRDGSTCRSLPSDRAAQPRVRSLLPSRSRPGHPRPPSPVLMRPGRGLKRERRLLLAVQPGGGACGGDGSPRWGGPAGALRCVALLASLLLSAPPGCGRAPPPCGSPPFSSVGTAGSGLGPAGRARSIAPTRSLSVRRRLPALRPRGRQRWLG